MRNQNWVLLTMVVIAILVGMLFQSAAVSAMAQFAYADDTVLGLVSTSTALGFVAFVITAAISIRNRRALTFTDEVVGELKQVSWPTRDETLRASTTVVLTTFFAAFLIALYDFLWKNLADLFLFTEG
ncbi:MAG: preprotein translocase subunit SecE [Alphaproteobacteria bacterium]|nr:preprotein translocase subunit SecE [Alphaproteobacteria bacterium]